MKLNTANLTLKKVTSRENTKLFFNFVCGSLDGNIAKELENLIKNDIFWKEYYLDMKSLFDRDGENALEIISTKYKDFVDKPLNDPIYKEILFYLDKLYILNREIENIKMTDNSKSVIDDIYEEVLEVGNNLLDVPKTATSHFIIRSRYCESLELYCNTLTKLQEYKNSNHQILEKGKRKLILDKLPHKRIRIKHDLTEKDISLHIDNVDEILGIRPSEFENKNEDGVLHRHPQKESRHLS